MSKTVKEIKIVVLGEGGVGKSTLVVRFINGCFVTEYDPTIEDSYRKQMEVDGEICLLEILDTAAYDDYYYSMTDMYIKNGSIFIILFSVINRSTMGSYINNMLSRIARIKDISDIEAGAMTILVCSKMDLKDQYVITRGEALELAKVCKVAAFLEVSSKDATNVDETFQTAVRINRKLNFSHATSTTKKKPVTGLATLLPWNWSKLTIWDKDTKKLVINTSSTTSNSISDIDIRKLPPDAALLEKPKFDLIPSDVYKDFTKYFNNVASPYDLIFFLNNDTKIYCHKIILSLRSTHLRHKFLSGTPKSRKSKKRKIKKIKEEK